jgi:hypothetical protein
MWIVTKIVKAVPFSTPATFLYDAPPPPSLFKTFSMRMPNWNPNLGDSWNRLGKLVSREGAIIGPRVVVRSVLVQEVRTRVLGSARTGQITKSQCGGSSKPLACSFTQLTDHTTSSCHARFIYSSNSSIGLIRVYQISMAKHKRYKGSSNALKQNLVMLGAVDQGI